MEVTCTRGFGATFRKLLLVLALLCLLGLCRTEVAAPACCAAACDTPTINSTDSNINCSEDCYCCRLPPPDLEAMMPPGSPCNFDSGQLYFIPSLNATLEGVSELAFLGETIEVGIDGMCVEAIQNFTCNYIFRPCEEGSPPQRRPLCIDYCEYITETDCSSDWSKVVQLIKTLEKYGVLKSDSLEFDLLKTLPNVSCNEVGSANVSCINQRPDSDAAGTDRELEKYFSVTVGVGSALILLLLVVIGCVLCCCGYRCWKRKTMPTSRERGYRYAYRSSRAAFTGRAQTLIGWPFVHPQHSRYKARHELFKLVPEVFMDVVSERQSYIVQHSRVHTTVFLADGPFSEVYQGNIADLQPHQTTTYRAVAVKRFKDTISSDDIIEYLEKSLNLSSIDHPNVLKVIAVTFDSLGNISIAYHYFEEHDLLTWLKKTRATVSSGAPPKDFSVKQLTNIIQQITLGMKAIAERGIPYKMLCARNCMIDAGSRVVVGDVSMSHQKALRGEIPAKTFHHWMAPEAIREKKFTEKSDVWAYGVTCWEVFTLGSVPSGEVENVSEVGGDATSGFNLPKPPLCPPSIFSLVERCWRAEPQDRPFFPELVSRLQLLLDGNKLGPETTDIDNRLRSKDTGMLLGSSPEYEVYPLPYATNPLSTTTAPPVTASSPLVTTSSPLVTVSSEIQMRDLTTPEGYLKLVANRDVGQDFADVGNVYAEPNVHVPRHSPTHMLADMRARSNELDSLEDEDYENTYLGPDKRHSLGAMPSSRADYEEFYYNLPKGFLEEVRTPLQKTTKFSDDLPREYPRDRSRSAEYRSTAGVSQRTQQKLPQPVPKAEAGVSQGTRQKSPQPVPKAEAGVSQGTRQKSPQPIPKRPMVLPRQGQSSPHT